MNVKKQSSTRFYKINGLKIGIDEESGSIIHLSTPHTGTMLDSESGKASLVDVAYPVDECPFLRLGSTFSKAEIIEDGDELIIRYESLAPSRKAYQPDGNVKAEVTIKPADDGNSVVLSCRIVNESKAAVPQVLFPDLHGFKPIGGPENTELRFSGYATRPFLEPIQVPKSASNTIYHRANISTLDGLGWKTYVNGIIAGYNWTDHSCLRWLDLGSRRGGLSVFQRKFDSSPMHYVMTQRTEADPMSMRLIWPYKDTSIEPGQAWQSDEVWLVPHRGGWAKGIKPYRDYVRSVAPEHTLSPHVRDGLGFRSIWMMQPLETDPDKIDFLYRDIPAVAEEAIVHGLDEICAWGGLRCFLLPLNTNDLLGTREDFIEAVRQAKAKGVNVTAFFSSHILMPEVIKQLDIQPNSAIDGLGNWTYHQEFVPVFRPEYSHVNHGVLVNSEDPKFLKALRAAMQEWIDEGIYSFCYDVFAADTKVEKKPKFLDLIRDIRRTIRQNDPEASFSGEPYGTEETWACLDYTWNWIDYENPLLDFGHGEGLLQFVAPIMNIHKTRLNCNIEDSAEIAKKGFCEGLYLNIMPRGLDKCNMTGWIHEKSELSAALKQLTPLRKQFLEYFVQGRPLGDSMLLEAPATFARGHLANNKLLVIVLNDSDKEKRVTVQSDLDVWLKSDSGSYEVKYYNRNGELKNTTMHREDKWLGETELLTPLDIAFFEIEAR